MKRIAALTCLITFAPVLSAAELLCVGNAFMGGTSYEHSTVVHFDSSTLKLATGTHNGWAEGTVRESPDLYIGNIYTDNGHKYWINLHRYTGEFYLGLADSDDRGIGIPEFTGDCSHAQRKF